MIFTLALMSPNAVVAAAAAAAIVVVAIVVAVSFLAGSERLARIGDYCQKIFHLLKSIKRM